MRAGGGAEMAGVRWTADIVEPSEQEKGNVNMTYNHSYNSHTDNSDKYREYGDHPLLYNF